MQVHLSVRPTKGLSKSERLNILYFTKYLKVNFKDLVKMLVKSYIYSPFGFEGYKRTNANLCTLADFVTIDVDHTDISIHDKHQMLLDEDLTHIIATTSDNNNMYKYRILFPLDKQVDSNDYRNLIRGLQHNGLITDMDINASCKPAGMFFSYENSTVLSYFDGANLCVDDYILELNELAPQSYDTVDVQDYIDKELNCPEHSIKGRRTTRLLAVAFTAANKGFNPDQIRVMVNHVNNKFLIPKSQSDVERRVIDLIKRTQKETNPHLV